MTTAESSPRREAGGESWLNLLRILSVRLAVLSVVLAAAWWWLPGDTPHFYALIALAYVFVVPYALWIRNNASQGDFSHLQFLVDVVLVTGLVYFTGGVTSGLILLYPLVILAAGIVATPLRALQITVLCVIIYLTLGLLTQSQIMVPIGTGLWDAMGRGYTDMAFTAGIFVLFGLASVFMAQRLTYLQAESREILRFRSAAQVAAAIAHDVRTPLASISGCVQVLEKLENRSLLGDLRSREILASERERLHQCIVDESDRLDQILEKFINQAEFSEERLQKLIAFQGQDMIPGPIAATSDLTPAS